jgi:hypothetical protein
MVNGRILYDETGGFATVDIERLRRDASVQVKRLMERSAILP